MPEDTMKKLNFEVPAKQADPGHRQTTLLTGLLILILLGVGADIWISLNPKGTKIPGYDGVAADSEQLKKIALKLEKSGLSISSASAWKEYMVRAGLDDKEAALIWYRIGKLYQDNDDYEQALDGYYRSESIYTIDSIAPEIALRIQECLESMGKFSAMRHELADRVTMQPVSPNDTLVAEIGTRKINASELDRRMEDTIERQMRMMAPYLPEKERHQQKETLLKEFTTPAKRMMFLNQYIGEEILYRMARETKLTEDPKIQDLLKDQERSLLASMALEKEYSDQIKITQSDLETYYAANKKAFMKEDKEQAFEDVKNDVYKALRSQKENDIRQQLLTRLKDEYDVVIHQSAFDTPPPQAETQARSTQTGNIK
ncbi:MAG: hypothetical protein COX19_15390 [Desulfobacterales bacterium CG23_combo_of_CG06-09_8_20_14_all_51_8]|nr:MAG: hypothetical protein COX19_15390 [Desulfobacterales bacterium CG23_combo_of_CG06-09_8_20_14_all_51_8]